MSYILLLAVTNLKDERLLADEFLDLEVVFPIGLTAHDASVEWKRVLERQGAYDIKHELIRGGHILLYKGQDVIKWICNFLSLQNLESSRTRVYGPRYSLQIGVW